jgi:PAS domain S-box-containing protein
MSDSPHRILVVEDHRLIAADIEHTLTRYGYVVVGNVSSGEEAITTADQVRPELVLIDVHLRGELDGIQTAAIIRDRFNAPAVYITAYTDEDTILRAKTTKPVGYLVKPFNERELRATIEIGLYMNQMERTLADEQAKHHAAEEFKILVDGIRDYAIFKLDRNGLVTTWNSGAERLKGYREDEIVGKHFSTFYLPEDVAARKMEHALEVAAREGRFEDEGWRIRKDGSRFWANGVITSLRTPDGDLIGFAKVTRDLTERRRAEEDAQRFQLLVDSVRDYAIFMLDAGGRITSWNAGATVVSGYTAEEIVGQHFSTLYPPEDVAAGKCERALEVAAQEGRFEDEGWRRRKDASQFWANTVITPLRTREGRLMGFARVTRDHTERRLAEERLHAIVAAEREISAEKSRMQEFQERFMAILGHDLIQPLTSIEVGLGLLGMRDTDPEFVRDVDRLHLSVRRMHRMIEQILDFTRSRLGGGLALVFAPMDLRDTLASIVEEVRVAHPAATIQLHCPQLRGSWDRDRLEQVFSNLLNNALTHGDSTKPVTATAGCEDLRVWIEIHNDGAPIPQELQTAIFHPFRRGERESPSPAGLGLGLYIANEVVLAHGGRIEVRSTAAEGTTFRVTLPRQAVATGSASTHDGAAN